MITFIALIAIYLVSVIASWKHTHIAHSKGGRWDSLEPSFFDVFMTFMPVINTLSALVGWGSFPPYGDKDNSNKLVVKFFGIDKKK